MSGVGEKAKAMTGAGLMVVATMCVGLLVVLVTASYLAVQGQDIPEALDRVLQGLLIGVPALLARTWSEVKGKDAEPQDVTVVNHPGEPVPIDPV